MGDDRLFSPTRGLERIGETGAERVERLQFRAQLWRNALLTEVGKATAGRQLAGAVQRFLLEAESWADLATRPHLAPLQVALAAYTLTLHHLQNDPALQTDVLGVLESFRLAATQQLLEDVRDRDEFGIDPPYPDDGTVATYTTAGTLRQLAGILGIDTLGVETVRSSLEEHTDENRSAPRDSSELPADRPPGPRQRDPADPPGAPEA